MNEAEIRVLVALAATDAHGSLIGNDLEDMVTLYEAEGTKVTGYIPREVIDSMVEKGYVELETDVACRISDLGRKAACQELKPKLREAWGNRILGGLTGAFYPLPIARRSPEITAAMIGLGWLKVVDDTHPHKFTDAAKEVLGLVPASAMSPEERRAADHKAQVEKDRIAYEHRLREASRMAIKGAEAEVVKQARAVLHSTEKEAAMDKLFASIIALEALEQAEDLSHARSEQPTPQHNPREPGPNPVRC